MLSIRSLIREKTKNVLRIFEYLVWLLLDVSKFSKIRKDRIKKVLIIHLGAFGEVLTATPLASTLNKSLNAEVYLMVSKGKEDIFKNNPYVSKVLIYEDDFKKNIRKLRKENIDLAVIIFPSSLRISLMCLFSNIKYRIGCYKGVKEGPSLFFNKRIFPINKGLIIQHYLDMIRQIGVDNKDPKIEIYLSDKEKKGVKKKLKDLGLKNYAIVHPGFSSVTKHKYPSRLWPLERYAKVIDYLIEKYGFKVLLTGSAEEKPISEKIKRFAKHKNKIIILNGLVDYRHLLGVIQKSKLIIAPSTMVVPISSAFKIPLIQLSGSEKKNDWIPLMPKENYRILYHKNKCTECGKNYCEKQNNECMNAITSEEVIKSINSLI